MKYIARVILLLSSAVLAVSCAKNPSDEPSAEQASFDAWMKKNEPGAKPLGDMYYYLVSGSDSEANRVMDGDWVMVDVVGYDLEGNIFYNSSDSMLAKRLGAFTRKTHYVPKKGLIAYNSQLSNGLTSGQMDMLLQMKEGDSSRVYMPSRLAYSGTGTSTSNGYEGNVQLGAGRPAVFDMKLRKVIKNDINAYEEDLVRAKASELGIPLTDTVRGNLIYKQSFGFKEMKPGDNTGNPITVDSSFYYYFTLRFLDDFVISTNVDTVAREAWGTSSAASSTPVLFDKSADGVSQVLMQVAEYGKIYYGEVFRVIYTSRYGYGVAGYPTSSDSPAAPYPVVEPYTPLVMEVYAMPIVRESSSEDKD